MKLMKKWYAVLLALIVIAAACPRAAYADGTSVVIAASKTSVAPGGTFTVSVGFQGSRMAMVQMDIGYDSGVLTLAKPTSPAMLTQALRWMHAVRERLRRMAAKNTSLEEKMADIRLVNRAKWLLITELSMTEPEAHRYIEKQAMDRCVPRRVIAQQIIQMYE